MKHFPVVHTAFCQHWCKSPGGRDLGLPFKLAPHSFNLALTAKEKKQDGENNGSIEQIQKSVPKFKGRDKSQGEMSKKLC